MTKISLFNNVQDNKPKTVDLDEWLEATISGQGDLKKQVQKYRKLRSKNLKLQIPCVTISAVFKKKRNLKNIKTKNNFIVLDIDRFAKDKKSNCNLCLDFDKVKSLMSTFPACYYVGYSVSSDGVDVKDGMYAIIKLKKGTSLIKAFKHFKKRLARIGINIDESCKDYTRLRFYSYDPDAYYNPKAKAFAIPKKVKYKGKASGAAKKSDENKVEIVIGLIEANQIDITSNYEDWYKIAGALYNAFGERGRDYFHRVSQFYPDYKRKQTDKKFNHCMNMKNVSLSSFFHIASNHGIRY